MTVKKEAPRFVGPGASRVVPLRYPVEYAGKVWEAVTIRPMTTKQYVACMEAMEGGGKFDLGIVDAPEEVLDYLFPDDTEEVNKAIQDFLPRALRTVLEQPATPGGTSPPSPQSSDSHSQNSSTSTGEESSASTSSP